MRSPTLEGFVARRLVRTEEVDAIPDRLGLRGKVSTQWRWLHFMQYNFIINLHNATTQTSFISRDNIITKYKLQRLCDFVPEFVNIQIFLLQVQVRKGSNLPPAHAQLPPDFPVPLGRDPAPAVHGPVCLPGGQWSQEETVPE